MTDEQILVMIRQEEHRESGYRLLMDTYQEMLYQHIRRIVRDHEDTNDVLQNTFIKVFRHIDKFKGKSSLYTWIYRIATNEALSQLNRSKKFRVINANDEQDNELENKISSDLGPEPKTINALLRVAIESLPDKQRSVFSLRYYDELSYKEISNIMGTSEGALKASYHHAVKKIEEHFKKANIF